MKNLKIIIPIILILAGGIFFWQFVNSSGVNEEDLGIVHTAGIARDLVGTRANSTTTAPVWYGTLGAASTTYPFRITNAVDTASFFFTTSSTTNPQGADIAISFLASNDIGCDTATTTTIYDVPTVDQIEWYDIGSHILNRDDEAVSVDVATTTLAWTPAEAVNNVITLTNLNTQCLAVEVGASSTALYMQVITKDNSRN